MKNTHDRYWWQLTEAEVARHNPPMQVRVFDENDNEYESVVYHEDWQPVGYIPRPKTRPGWFMYHLIHGLVMRYPWWKVLGFAFANTKPAELIDFRRGGYVEWEDVRDTGMTFEEWIAISKEGEKA
jgi:hypothetical protein